MRRSQTPMRGGWALILVACAACDADGPAESSTARLLARPTVVARPEVLVGGPPPSVEPTPVAEDPSLGLRLPDGFDDPMVQAYLARRRQVVSAETPFTDDETCGWNSQGHHYPSIPGKDPRTHPYTEAMTSTAWLGGPDRRALPARAFMQPIPRQLHWVQTDSTEAMESSRQRAWANYASTFGYSLRVWRLEDRAVLPAANLAAFEELMRRGMAVAAGQMLSMSILAHHGGILLGRHAQPPAREGRPADFGESVPMRGLVVVASPVSRLLKETSTWALWDVLMASAGHPVLTHMQQQAPKNVASCLRAGVVDPRFLTGSILLSQALGGVYTLVPAHSARELGLLRRVDLDR